jgi:hypothetical protein
MIDNAENRWHLYVSVEELSEAMMLGDQTEMVVSQRRDVSHNHKEGRPAVGRSRHAQRGPASCCWLPSLSSENALRPQATASSSIQTSEQEEAPDGE